jgi:hypothetical protein
MDTFFDTGLRWQRVTVTADHGTVKRVRWHDQNGKEHTRDVMAAALVEHGAYPAPTLLHMQKTAERELAMRRHVYASPHCKLNALQKEAELENMAAIETMLYTMLQAKPGKEGGQ